MQQHSAHGQTLLEIALGVFWLQIISQQENLRHRKQLPSTLKAADQLLPVKHIPARAPRVPSYPDTPIMLQLFGSLQSAPGILSDKGDSHLLHSLAAVSLNRLLQNDRRGILCDRQVIWFVLIPDIGSICLESGHLIWCYRFINKKVRL